MKKKNKTNDSATIILILSVIVFIMGVFVLGSLYNSAINKEELETLRNQTAINISNAYIEGALYTYQTGRVVVPEQTINGIQIKEYPIEEICNNLNKTNGGN